MGTPNINHILRANPRPCSYGAPMGAGSFTDTKTHHKCYLQKVDFIDGDYAPDGTYWGNSPKTGAIYCAFNGVIRNCANGVAQLTRIYVRAKNRRMAIDAVLSEFPTVQFFRG